MPPSPSCQEVYPRMMKAVNARRASLPDGVIGGVQSADQATRHGQHRATLTRPGTSATVLSAYIRREERPDAIKQTNLNALPTAGQTVFPLHLRPSEVFRSRGTGGTAARVSPRLEASSRPRRLGPRRAGGLHPTGPRARPFGVESFNRPGRDAGGVEFLNLCVTDRFHARPAHALFRSQPAAEAATSVSKPSPEKPCQE